MSTCQILPKIGLKMGILYDILLFAVPEIQIVSIHLLSYLSERAT